MMGLLDGDLKAVFGSVFGPLLLDGTLTPVSMGYDDGGDRVEVKGTPVAVKLMREDYSAHTRAVANIPATDVRLIILQEGIGITPTVDDRVTLGSDTYDIVKIAQDPANAAWTMQARLRKPAT